jgi:hypothetical protein
MAAPQPIENQQRLYEGFEKKHYMECTTRFRGLCRKFCSGGRAGAGTPVCGGDEAAREENSAAAVQPSLPPSTTRCRCLLMCISARPTRVACAASNALTPSMGQVMHFTPRWACATMLLRDLL